MNPHPISENDLLTAEEAATLEQMQDKVCEIRLGVGGLPQLIAEHAALKVKLAIAEKRAEAAEKVAGAARRLRANEYLDWKRAGGPNECAHGYAAGFACPK